MNEESDITQSDDNEEATEGTFPSETIPHEQFQQTDTWNESSLEGMARAVRDEQVRTTGSSSKSLSLSSQTYL